MATQSVLSAASICDNLSHLVDETHAGEADCLEWAMGRIVISGERIWQNLAISSLLHMALALLLLVAPFAKTTTNPQVLQVQLVSMGGDGDLSAAGCDAPGGGPPAASEAGKATPPGKAADNSAENTKSDTSNKAQLIEAENKPVQAEATAPMPEEKPVPVDESKEPAPIPAREAIKKTPKPPDRPLPAAKSNLQKAAPDDAKTRSEADSRPASDSSSSSEGNPQLRDQDGGKSSSTGSGEGSGAQAGHGRGGPSGSGPFEAQFGSPNGPRFLRKATPNYPHQARQMEKEGTVILHVTIDEMGRAVEIELVKKAGHGFDEEAIKAVRNSTFAPAKKDGRPITCKAVLPIRFVLKNTED